jgi:uncharacterized membrane protein YozB (DUF420 family)
MESPHSGVRKILLIIFRFLYTISRKGWLLFIWSLNESGETMIDSLYSLGFLGTQASLLSDISLSIILLTAILFTIGWRLIRKNHVEAHRCVQTAAAILNAVVVLGVMISFFVTVTLPGLSGKVFEGTYGVTTVHALVGLIGLVLGLYVVISSNKLLPRRFRFTNNKLIMRISYVLYMVATLLGVIVYIEAYAIGI